MTKIYISAPFRAASVEGAMKNVEKAIGWGGHVMATRRAEVVVVHPRLVEGWGIEGANSGEFDKEISDYCLEKIRECDTMVICGDHISKGMSKEIEEALKIGIPVEIYS